MIEVNPAAFILARFYSLANLSAPRRRKIFDDAVNDQLSIRHSASLKFAEAVHLLSASQGRQKALLRLAGLLLSLPSGTSRSHLADARSIPLPDCSVGTVITSPPYINVFNYHQQYRKAAEDLGYEPLKASRSEIGANRKFRQNRYLTVIQYCLDMDMVLDELARLVTPGGRVIVVVGVESRVLGAAFDNSAILKHLIDCHDNFELGTDQTRSFVNRYGARIAERVIVATKVASPKRKRHPDSPRSIAESVLQAAAKRRESTQPAALLNALKQVPLVEPSELFRR
jgi:hypothetical protein